MPCPWLAALLDHVTAKRFLFGKKHGEFGALCQIQDWTRRGTAGFGQFRRDLVRLELIGGVLDGRLHSAERVSRLGADHPSELLREIVRRRACH